MARPRPLLVAAAFVVVALGPVGAAPAQGTPECPSGAELPTVFPLDAYVFRARVLAPVLPLDAEAGLGAGWVMSVEVTLPVHLPDSRRRFDLMLRDDDCGSLDRATLIDRFVTDDVIEVAAFGSVVSRPELLTAPGAWVRILDENTSRGIDTPFEYFAALFDLERREDDSQRALGLRRIAEYLESEELFAAVVASYIDGKRLRKQLRSVHRDLHPEGGSGP